MLAAGWLIGLGTAQAAPDLTGEWKLNAAKSEYGPVPAPDVMTRSVRHQDPALHIATYQKGPQGEVRTELNYTTDGAECVNKIQGSEAKGTAKWQGNNLVVESTRDLQGTQIKSTETWILSDGGKVLTINNHIAVPQMGEFDVKLVFEKQ